jgi:glycolate oxidase iron-sulfur subunit
MEPLVQKECKNIEKYKDELDKCTLCGNCRMICPVFKVNKRETASTRGRISLMHGLLNQQNIKFSPRSVEYLKMCLNCQSCMRICPANVEYGKLITSARADIVAKKESPFLKQFFLTKILTNNKYLTRFYKFLGIFQRLFFKNQNKKNAFSRFVYNLLNFDSERVFPQIAKENFFSPKLRSKVAGDHNKRVALFIGCSARYLNPETTEHLIEILRRNKIQVLIPKDQLCCGRPALNAGEIGAAKKMAMVNLSVFNNMQDISAIISLCGSCGDMLNREYPGLVADSKFRLPVYDIMEFIRKEKIMLKPRYADLKITYHHPCSQNRGGNLKETIPELISDVYKKNFVESKNAEDCCGGGLGFNLSFYQTAKAISASKIADIMETGADLVATGCPHCIMRINEQARIQKVELMVKHTIDIYE